MRVLANTFWIAGISTVAWSADRLPVRVPHHNRRRAVASPSGRDAVLVPFWSSLLVRTYAWQVILRDTGAINSSLIGWGSTTAR